MFSEADINQRFVEGRKFREVLVKSGKKHFVANPIELPFDQTKVLKSSFIFKTDYDYLVAANVVFAEIATNDPGTLVEFGIAVQRFMSGEDVKIYGYFNDLITVRNQVGGLAYLVSASSAFKGDVSGTGFLAMAVLIFGEWKPGIIMLAALFFGAFQVLPSVITIIPALNEFTNNNPKIPLGTIFRLMPYLLTIIALIATSKRSRAPKSAGISFDFKAN